MNIGTVRVPNEGSVKSNIYLIGEGPGADEVDARRPFVGVSGLKLRGCLARNGIAESDVYFGNLCQYRPPNNVFAAVLKSRELQVGIEELADTIAQNKPNVIAALGNWPLFYLTGRRGKKAPGTGIGKWRGSILPCILPGCEGVKVVASYHPAYVVRQPTAYPVFDTDIKRVVYDSSFPELKYPVRNLVLDPRADLLEEWTERLCGAEYLAVDIETVKRTAHILCVGFSPDPFTSVVISHSSTDFARREAIDRILRSPVKKVFHNGGTFDIPILEINDYYVENYYWDTMVAQHVMWGELPKSLDYLASVHTRQPYYKTAGRAEIPDDAKGWSEKFDRNALYEYNGTDTGVTAEVFLAQVEDFKTGPHQWQRVFDFEMSEFEAAATISRTGMMIDLKRRDTLRRALQAKWAIIQFVLNNLVKLKVNVNSSKQMKMLLYDKDKLGLPPRKNHEGNLTTDEDAIVSLIAFAKDKLNKLKPGGNANAFWQLRVDALNSILLIRGIRKLLSSYINIRISDDGRLRATFKPVSTETGRWACAVYFDGTGTNAQTFPREVFELKNYEDDPFLKEMLPYILESEAEDVGIEIDETIETEEAVAV